MKKRTVFFLSIFISCLFMGAEDTVSLTPYGYVKLDAIYETGSSYPGNYTFWVQDPGASNGLFHLTANQTRLGIKINGLGFGSFKVTGNVEIDFYGGNAENKAYNFMRKAYLEISNGTFSVIAGQNSDIISPLVPSTLNYTVLWACGNVGYRRPQLAIKNIFKIGQHSVALTLGVTRSIGDGLNGGIALGIPTFQGRLNDQFALGSTKIEIGVSGHMGKSKASDQESYTTSSVNADVKVEISPSIKILAEYFNGKNLGAYMGGINQSLNKNNQEIHAQGFYVNLLLSLSGKTQVSLAYGQDNPKDADLLNNGRSLNFCYFGNLVHPLSKSLSIALEISQWQTNYLTLTDDMVNTIKQKNFRIQHAWILSF